MTTSVHAPTPQKPRQPAWPNKQAMGPDEKVAARAEASRDSGIPQTLVQTSGLGSNPDSATYQCP